MRSSRASHVGHTVVEQVLCLKLSVDVDKHPVGGLPLAGMTGHGKTVIEMRMLSGVEADAVFSILILMRPSPVMLWMGCIATCRDQPAGFDKSLQIHR